VGRARHGAITRAPAVTQEEVRRHNLGVLLSLLHVRGRPSRAELTAVSGLNRSTVRALTTELADAGLVREAAPVGRGGAGRPSILVEPRSEAVWALAVDVGVEHLSAAGSARWVVLDRRERRQPRGDGGVLQVLDRVRALVEPLLAAATTDPVGIGVAVPGMVGGPGQLVRLAPNLGWVDVPLGLLLGGPAAQHTAVAGRQRGRPRGDGRTPARGRRGTPPTRSSSPARSASAAA
jgi:hypothetical protein